MKNISKQLGGWAIKCKDKYYLEYKRNPFLLTRLRLTFIYTLGVSVIIIFFSFAVYLSFSKNISDNLEYSDTQYSSEMNIERHVISKAQEQLQTTIITIDLFLILLIIVMSYYVAGKTLIPLKKSYDRQKKFVADTAHELRTPLAVMKTGAEFNISSGTNKERLDFIIDSIEEIDHLSKLVDDLLVLSRCDDHHVSKLGDVDLSDTVDVLLKTMLLHAEHKNIRLTGSIDKKCHIKGNSVYIKRLLTNLIQNSIDYNKQNGKIKVSLTKYNSHIELKVEDTGIGISKEDLSHIFDRFYKADSARTTSKGSGLGLSIVKEIIAIHEADIMITSELKKYTTVKIIFPSK